MPEKACRLCGAKRFYIKNPDDAWETWKFEKKGDEIKWLLDEDQDEPPPLTAETQIFCDNCVWRGQFKDIH